jgi:hypothetical protein
MRSNKADREETCTHKVESLFQKMDDFLTMRQVIEMTGLKGNQVGAVLHHLKRVGVLESMESEGRLYWYVLGKDTRTRTVEERVKEPEGNRSGRKAKKLFKQDDKWFPVSDHP